MKARVFAAVWLMLGCAISARSAEDYVRESGWAGETFTSKVIKDLSFQDGGAEYTAYLVKWKDHEVVVTAPIPLEKRYAVGDTVRCQMVRREFTHGGEVRSQITFMLMAGPTHVDPARLKAVTDEVAARRAIRDKAAEEVRSQKKQE